VGELDEEAFEEALAENPDEALSMLAKMTGATDEKLRALAQRLAGRLVLDLARSGPPRARGVGRLRTRSAAVAIGDIDVESSLDALIESRASGEPPRLEDVMVREWSRPDTALCLVIDKSGSMGGDRLAAAGLAAAAAAFRAPIDHSVVAFAEQVIVIKAQDTPRHAEEVVEDIFGLRGHGPTDLDFALASARAQLERSRAKRRLTILLSDCKTTVGADPLRSARMLDELVIIAPAEECEEAEEFAKETGAKLALLEGPSGVPAAFAKLLDI
jgi:Mg-chelatase subunit ChlD